MVLVGISCSYTQVSKVVDCSAEPRSAKGSPLCLLDNFFIFCQSWRVRCNAAGLTSPALEKGGCVHEAHNEADRGGASHGGNDVGYYGDAGVRAARAATVGAGAAGRDGNDNSVRRERGRSRNASRDDCWALPLAASSILNEVVQSRG